MAFNWSFPLGLGAGRACQAQDPAGATFAPPALKTRAANRGEHQTSQQNDLGMKHGVPHLLLRISSRCELEHSRWTTL